MRFCLFCRYFCMTEKMINIRYLLISTLLFLGSVVAGQPASPGFRCISVNTDGSVSLSWTTSGAITDFDQYEIHYSSSAVGPYNLAGTVADESVLTFDHTVVNANAQTYFYYLKTVAGGVGSEPTDTLQTIMLFLTKINSETAQLSWNAPGSPLPEGSSLNYEIYREYPTGTWTLAGTTPSLEYTDRILFCNQDLETVNYRVTLENTAGCSSHSVIRGDIFFNGLPPGMPELDSVSVTPDGRIVIGWSENPEPDVYGYIIYRVLPGSNDSIAFVPGKGNTLFFDNSQDPCFSSFSYAISVIDSCGNKSPGTYDVPQRTLLMDEISYDACGRKNTISWNGYINFDPFLSHYDLYVSINGGPFTMLDNINNNLNYYEHTNLQSNTTYEYFIRAVSGDGKTSSSCTKSVTTYDSPEPGFMYLSNVTVTEDENVEIRFYTDTSAYVYDYKIYRGTGPSGPFTEIGSVAPSDMEVLTFLDTEADVQTSSYYYKVTVTDSCLNELELANNSRTVYLMVTANADRTNDLSWNDYTFWEGGVESYDIYRLLDGTVDAVFSTGGTSWSDDVSGLGGSGRTISYYVEAHEGGGNPYGFMETSRSNEATALQESLLFVPNAFRPGGINSTFKPVTSFISSDGYYFAIYNRWGQQVFETTDPGEAWNGTTGGSPADQGVFVYLIRYRLPSGAIHQVTGNVMVLR